MPLLVYLVVLSRLWANAPVWDDYGTVLDTLTRMGASKSAAEWLELLVHQHNEHRIFTVRLVTRAVEALPGPLDFRLLVFLGNAAFLGFVAVLQGNEQRLEKAQEAQRNQRRT